MGPWRPLPVRVVGLVALVVGVLSLLLWHVLGRSGTLVPRPSWFAGVTILALAAFILVLAWPVRVYLAGRASRPLDPGRAARTVALAHAAALTGGAVVGWYAGQLAEVFTGLSLAANRGRIVPLLVLVVAAFLLAASGLLAQSWCRVDPPGDDDEAPGPSR